ncbi:hypothetical protein [Acinetobacter modestus]|uniref:hypothetical protein n=1 Tax=Acinetobacter modestus TaxID=1776740 RepID=UPI003017F11F
MIEIHNTFLLNAEKHCNLWSWLCSFEQFLKYVPILTFCLGLIAFCFAVKTYRRKSAIAVNSTFEFAFNWSYSGKHFLYSYTLENMKDKSIVIYAVYLRIGFDLYLQLEDFRYKNLENRHLILKAYEIYQQDMERPYWFHNMKKRIDIDELIADRKVKKSIVISTSYGKYVTQTKERVWVPYEGSENILYIMDKELYGHEDWERGEFVKMTRKDISNNKLEYWWKKLLN